MKALMLAIALLVAPLTIRAEVLPTAGVHDKRVREVVYNARDVIRVSALYGVSTHIEFGDKEEILQDGISIGDAAAWEVTTSNKKHLFLKPVAREYPDTNLIVITNKRAYQFQLAVAKHDAKTGRPKEDVFYALHFQYPEDIAAAQAAKAKAEEDAARREDIKRRLTAGRSHRENTDYWVNGSSEVAPTYASDDGRFMYLEFGNNRDMPSIFEINDSGNEAMVNTTVEGNTIIVQRTYRKLILRKGEEIACLVNKSFDIDAGRDNQTGTVSDSVQRVVKGEQ